MTQKIIIIKKSKNPKSIADPGTWADMVQWIDKELTHFLLFIVDRKHLSSDEKSKQKPSSSSSSKKHSSAVDTNGFEAAMMGFDKPGKKDVKKKVESSSTSKQSSSKEDPSKAKNNNQVTAHHSTTLSVPNDLNPNYQPAKEKPPPVAAPAHMFSHLTDGKTDDEALSALISMSKNAKRTAVYSGSKRYKIYSLT